MQDEGKPYEKIDAVFRNGTMTGVGVITGFSLTFLCAWAGNPLPWKWIDLVAVGPMILGILCQIVALAGLLSPNSLIRPRYNRLTVIFLAGLGLVVTGIAAALVLDAMQIGQLRFG